MAAVMPGISARFIPLCVLCALLSGTAMAHTSLGEYVQHRYILCVSSKYIDLTVELAFNGDPAEAERAAMDTDENGVISRDEQRARVAKWEKSGGEQIRLFCGRTDIPVTALYAPELDLEGDRGAGRHPVIVRLKFFARTPKTLAHGEPMCIESSLQLNVPALVALEVSGDAAPPITIEPRHGDTLPALKTGNRTFEVQCPKFERAANAGSRPELSTKPTVGG